MRAKFLLSAFLAFAVQSAAQPTLIYEIRAANPDWKKIAAIESNLRKLPDYIAGTLNDFGGKLVIFDGPPTELDELRALKGKKADMDIPYESAGGVYDYGSRTAYLSQDGTAFCNELHEVGHMADHAFGFPSHSQPFRSAVLQDGAYLYYFPHTRLRQIFAEAFRDFYCSEKRAMDKYYPNVLRYFAEFDSRAKAGAAR